MCSSDLKTLGESDQLSIESFLLDSLIGDTPRRIRVEFLARLRGERQFESPEALKAQIMRDVLAAQNYFRRTQKWTHEWTQAWTASTCPPATS